jgi:hypothetical protein
MAYDQPPTLPPPPIGAKNLRRVTAQDELVFELDESSGIEADNIGPKKRGRHPSPFYKYFVNAKDKATMQCTSCLVVLSHQTSRYDAHRNKCSAF